MKDVVLHLEQENQHLKKFSEETADSAGLVQQAKAEYQRQLENVYRQIEELRAENTQLRRQVVSDDEVDGVRRSAEEFASRVRELEMVNGIQAEKNEYLQYELIKSRAQVVGLERVCENIASPTSVKK